MFTLQDTLNEEREVGREEGRKEREKTALTMLKDGLNVESIIKYTSFLKKEVQALARKHGLKLKRSQ